MLKREAIATELWKRLSTVSGVVRVERNPENPPTADDMPCILLFDLPDIVTSESKGRKHPRYQKEFQIVVELFTKAASSEESSRAIITLLELTLKALFDEPVNLGGLGNLSLDRSTRLVTVNAANHIKAIGLSFKVKYAEDIGDLFTT